MGTAVSQCCLPLTALLACCWFELLVRGGVYGQHDMYAVPPQAGRKAGLLCLEAGWQREAFPTSKVHQQEDLTRPCMAAHAP